VDIITVVSKLFQKEGEDNDVSINWKDCSSNLQNGSINNCIFEYQTFDPTGMDCLIFN
jgi:hypothetical protein